ncbi:UDP-glucuronosyl/UDP-glucosyltransferase [Macleaya cordata]|uniref:Glycosyltransferase n=1 Tax=Macleaya cordata TaxID=56857 RepID=A0A200QYW3_MACCD|nr:UDP-glucuronosyl/UDP-glucosyltransferase [Macleaya cordata]
MDCGIKLHIAMFPCFAMGHLTSFLHISNKRAARGHRISFLIPTKTQSKLNTFNLHAHLIRFIPLVVPHVDGLPPGAETAADVPLHLQTLIITAMDCTEPDVEAILLELKPDIVFFDITHWIPALTRRLHIKSIYYSTVSAATIAYLNTPERMMDNQSVIQGSHDEPDLTHPPMDFPPNSVVKLHVHEARACASLKKSELGRGISFDNRIMVSLSDCDAIAFKSCREMEGPFCDYLASQFKKPILLSGPGVPEPPTSTLDEKWVNWLGGFKERSVIYCALGSQWNLKKDQFMELVLGLELTGLPFLAVLKPIENTSIEEALPEGFRERVEGRGLVEGGWVQQQLILGHPSVGCFVTHCGSGSLTEALVNECQIVLLPQFGDQFVNARLMGGDLKVGVEIERGKEDGLFTKEGVCKAVKMVMDQDNEVGKEVRINHAKWKDFLLRDGVESSYTNDFIKNLRDLLSKKAAVHIRNRGC